LAVPPMAHPWRQPDQAQEAASRKAHARTLGGERLDPRPLEHGRPVAVYVAADRIDAEGGTQRSAPEQGVEIGGRARARGAEPRLHVVSRPDDEIRALRTGERHRPLFILADVVGLDIREVEDPKPLVRLRTERK